MDRIGVGSVKPLKTGNRNAPSQGRADARWIALWGGGAMLFALVGISSMFLASSPPQPGVRIAGRPLPPQGDVGTTASITPRGPEGIEIYPSSGGVEGEQARRALKAEMETLRRQVAELRRAMSVMQERNVMLSARIDDGPRGKGPDAHPGIAPTDEATREQAAAPDVSGDIDAAVDALAGEPKPVETLPAPPARRLQSRTAPLAKPPSAADTRTADRRRMIEETLPETLRSPVRIVAAPGIEAPTSVASIPQGSARASVPAVKEKPLLSITGAAGRIALESADRIERTDFAIDLGTYASTAEAEAAWKELKATQSQLPQTLETRIIDEANGSVHLFAGPYPNAADAAAACVYLGSGAITCRPVTYPREVAASR